ncbi:MAG: hypothetical protein RIR96_1326 [Bacteroidota bacterium]
MSQAKRAERSGLLLSLVYRKVTCDISKSKKAICRFFFEFLGAVRDLRKRQRNEEYKHQKAKIQQLFQTINNDGIFIRISFRMYANDFWSSNLH